MQQKLHAIEVSPATRYMPYGASLPYHLASFLEHKSLQYIDHHRTVAPAANLWLLSHCKSKYIKDQGIVAGAEKPERRATNHLVSVHLQIAQIQ